VFVSIYRLHIADVIFIIENFGLDLYFLACKLFQKIGGHMLTTKIGRIAILPVRPGTGKPNRSDQSTRLIYVANLIVPLCRACRVDQFTYLICPNQISDEKVM
jgi:hypothetical protein